ncbi:CRISPR-associated endonuclease Cas2 [Halosquirtibacter laminarini]|uniref:CRISPR-associated endonuclease Cas2 n=1 Tax=Halosquirtibacter laminarini TaxID=3374600 RepID=A0AC61NPX7_9BACT|nr:CRISPR-associated endonuclease Cas2 [Prolixibacteraceae bacterium]
MAKKRKELTFYEKIQRIKEAGIKPVVVGEDQKDEESLKSLDQRIQEMLGLSKSRLKHNEMIFFVMYDIEDNRVRTQVSKFLLKKGCHRVQKSIFLGRLERKQYNEIATALKEIQEFYENKDSILLVPVSSDEMRAMKIIGENVDFDVILRNRNTLFF